MAIWQFIFLLLVLYLGSRKGGVGLGVVAGIGLVVEVFIFRMPPTSPPVGVILIIMAVVTCASILEEAGGLKYMLQIAERILRNHPKQITLLGPLVTYTMTLMLGTGHAVYSVMPIIGDIALKKGIRPERPMAAASVASQLGITTSPISAAVVYYLAQMSAIDDSITLLTILSILLPATLSGVLMLSLYSMQRGVELQNDPEYQRRMQDSFLRDKILATTSTALDEKLPVSARNGVLLFLAALLSIVFIAMVPAVRNINGHEISMAVIIQIMMLAFGGLILLVTGAKASRVPEGVVFKAGMVAAFAIYGITWMSDTYFTYVMPSFKESISVMVNAYPWTIALAMFMASVVINSQAATARMMLPVAIGMGLPPQLLIGIMPSVYGYFFIPNYPSDIATCNFDVTGTTRIGKFYFNHSFMVPGFIGVIVACVVGYLLAGMII